MNKSTLQNILIVSLFLAVSLPFGSLGQDQEAESNDESQVENYREQIKRLMGFLEFSLNTLGDPETSTKEKEVIINESYIKAFMSDKVQIEDDLDENREILTYKDVQAYLKDVDFFFKQVQFHFDVQEIQSLTNIDGMNYFKVTANRNLKGITVDGQQVDNNKIRYIEINLDDNEQVLKIASIYTTRLNEAEELMTWWNNMPQGWKDILGKNYIITDTIPLSALDLKNDSTVLLVHEVPVIVEGESYIQIGENDSLLVIKEDTTITKKYDTLQCEKGAGYRALREIVKLEKLNVSGDLFLYNLYPISQLSELTYLDISNTGISDLFPVRTLTKLESLNISGTGISDLDPIRYNTRIRDLYIDSTLVDSIESISGFSELEILHMSGSLVSDLSPLRGLSQLKDLKMDNTPVADLSPLADLANVQNLSLSSTQVESLDPIQYMITLNRIAFKNTSISDLSALSKLENIRIIDADQTQISDLKPVGDIPSLEKIYCDGTRVTRSMANAFMTAHPNVLVIYESQGLIAWWKGLDGAWQSIFRSYATLDPEPTKEQLHEATLMNRIDIEGNKNVTNLDPLSMLTNLQEINCSGTGISDLRPLSELTDLVKLNCSGTQITSLIPLQALVRMEELDCSDTPLESLDGLKDLKNLRILAADRTNISDPGPLDDITALRFIYCDNTKVNKAVAGTFTDHHPDCLVVFQTDVLKAWWNGLNPEWKSAFNGVVKMDSPPTREQLHTLSVVTSLDLSGRREITSLVPLKMLSRLEELDLTNGTVQDISPLSDLSRLKKLILSGNPISDVRPIGNLPGLKILDISNTPIEKLDDLKSLSFLEQLNCSGTQIKKLDPLAYMFSLKKLECQNTGINNLKPLVGLNQLKNLSCYNTRLNQKKVDSFKEEMPGIEVVFY